MNPTPDQSARKQAVETLDQNVFLEASAGTGKTHTLTSRIVHLITTGTARIEEIAAITFTEAATAELKARVRSDLQKRVEKEDVRDDEKELVVRALRDIDLARISTLHSFAFSLLRERPIEAGIDPGAVGMDQVQTDELFAEVWAEWIDQQMADETHPLLAHLIAYGITTSQLEELAKELYSNRDIVLDPEYTHPPASASLLTITTEVDDLTRRMYGQLRDGIEYAHNIGLESDDGALGYLELRWQELNHFKNIRKVNQARAVFSFLQNATLTVKATYSQPKWPDEHSETKKQLKKDLQAINKEITDLRQQMAESVSNELLNLNKRFIEHMNTVKRARGLLDFMDLLIGARDLLRDNKQVRNHFQSQMKTLLIDEFQDTDPIQAEIAFFLAEKGAQADHWEDVSLEPGRLFIVGDPKQSIYRFRRADIELFQSVRSKVVEQGGLFAELTHSFRSVPGVIDWVNTVFDELIQEPPPEEPRHQPKYSPLSPHRETIGESSVYQLEHRDFDPQAPFDITQARIFEAESIATFIANLIANGHKVLDKHRSKQRELTPGDIAILFRKTSNIDLYTGALEAQGVPYKVEGGKTYYKREEVRAVTAAITLIADPADSVAFVAAARSFLFGVSDTELLVHRQNKCRFTTDTKVNTDLTPAIAQFLEVIKHLGSLVNELSTAQLIGELYRLTGSIEVATTRNAHQQRVQNLMKIQELAGTRSHSPGLASLRAFALWLDSMSTNAQDESESPSADETEEQVTLMTIHKSKGLDFNVVVMADMNTSGGGGGFKPEFLVDKESRLFGFKIGSQIISPGLDEIKDINDKRDKSEEKRLYYVASTRARDMLVYSGQKKVSGKLKPQNPQLLKAIEAPLQGRPHLVTDWVFRPTSGPYESTGSQSIDPAIVEKTRLARGDWVRLQSEMQNRSNRIIHLSAADLKGDSTNIFKSGQKGMGPEFGSALHSVMEKVRFDEASDDVIDRLIIDAANEFDLTDSIADILKGQVRRALKHPIIKRAAASPRVLRELPFTIRLNKSDIQALAPEVYVEISDQLKNEVTLDGIIDLLFEEDGKLVVVDYKTDAVEGDELTRRTEFYKPQIELYRKAAADLTGMSVAEASLLFTQ